MKFVFDPDLGVEKEGAVEYGGIDFEMTSLATCCTQVLGAEEISESKKIQTLMLFFLCFGETTMYSRGKGFNYGFHR